MEHFISVYVLSSFWKAVLFLSIFQIDRKWSDEPEKAKGLSQLNWDKVLNQNHPPALPY